MSMQESVLATPPGRRVTVAVDVTAAGSMTGVRMLEVVEAHGRYYFEGDILVAPFRVSGDAIKYRSVVFGNRLANKARLWKGAVVPYACHPSLTGVVDKAIEQWQLATPVRFRPYSLDRAFVVFTPGTVNASAVGCEGDEQMVILRKDATVATAMHEIGHVLGLWHEHSRSDRDQHVLVHRQNILSGQGYQFDQVIKNALDFGPYDTASIMHYDSFAFSGNSKETITKMDGGLIAQNDSLSPGDIATIAAMYT